MAPDKQEHEEEKDKDGLTDQQAAFCEEYLLDLNATQAAKRAGYAAASANRQGSRLLTYDGIRARIAALMDARSQRTLVNADFVIGGLLENVHRCQQAQPVMVYDAESGEMVQKHDSEGRAVYDFDSQGANKALELLGRHLGMFIDKSKIEQTVTNIGPVVVDVRPSAVPLATSESDVDSSR